MPAVITFYWFIVLRVNPTASRPMAGRGQVLSTIPQDTLVFYSWTKNIPR